MSDLEFLYPYELSMMQGDADSFVQDRQFAGTVLYRSFVSRGSMDPTTGRQIAVYAGTWVNAVRALVTDVEQLSSESRYQLGNVTYLIRPTEVRVPKKEDRIADPLYGEHYVNGYATDIARTLHSIICRNLSDV